jgi:hypothetical protein
MFALAMAAKQRGMGTVGSTQNILDFIAGRLQEACDRPFPDTLQARAARPLHFLVHCLLTGVELLLHCLFAEAPLSSHCHALWTQVSLP